MLPLQETQSLCVKVAPNGWSLRCFAASYASSRDCTAPFYYSSTASTSILSVHPIQPFYRYDCWSYHETFFANVDVLIDKMLKFEIVDHHRVI